jgi:hypothetical protein
VEVQTQSFLFYLKKLGGTKPPGYFFLFRLNDFIIVYFINNLIREGKLYKNQGETNG